MAVPYTINRYLRDYQREGIHFIYNNYAQSRGCILGDDMGLGKTIQVVGFLAAVLHKTGTWEDIENSRPQFLLTQVSTSQSKPSKVFLIVAPLSLLYNWKDELETWGYFQCVVVHGLRKEEELARVQRGRSEIALTTYETLRLCLEQFNSIDWSAVIVDEAHKIKNPNSQITQAMKDLRCEVRVGLTGTILQNNLEELWCVMDWAIPGSLGSLSCFKNTFSDPIEQGQRHSATKRTLAIGRKAVRALTKKISHWFLRRTKALIKDQLPKKDDRVVYCSLTEFQRTVYQTVLNCEDVTLLLRSQEKCDCGNGYTRRRCCYKVNSEGVEMKHLYFSYLAILRKVASHVALLQSTTDTSKKQDKYVKAICSKVFQKFPDFVVRCKQESFVAMSDPIYSGKMKVLQKLLKHYKRDKVLLFSMSTKLLNVLESYCMAEGLEYSRLDGTTKARERVKIVKEFNSSPHINLCLVSTMAGGLGLNFVGANVVILFDPTWNPANDMQAIDRAYRIGQCRDVTVLRLISLGTVEEVIYLRQVYKQQLQCSVMGRESARRYFEAVQGAVDQKGELFGIQNLFRLQTQGTCLTHRILEREGRVEAGVMTSSTHTEEEEEDRKRDGLSGQGLKDNAASPGIHKGVLDFSSDEEEDKEDSVARRKDSESRGLDGAGSTSTCPGRRSLLQHGFSKLLHRSRLGSGAGRGGSSLRKEDSGGGSDPEEDGEHPGTAERKTGIAVMEVDSPRTTGSPAMGRGGIPKGEANLNSDVSTKDLGREREEPLSMSEESEDMRRERSDVQRSDRMKKNTKRKMVIEENYDDDSKTAPPRGHQFGYCSDESEDMDMEVRTRPRVRDHHPQQRGRGTRAGSSSSRAQTKTPKRAEDIEAFTSSEDDQPPNRRCRPAPPQTGSRAADRKLAGPVTDGQSERLTAVSCSGLKTQVRPVTEGASTGTIDIVLDGVQGVAYTHSNQQVVGGSKAEGRIVRAALKHVFQRRMYSQVPANQLLDSQESPPCCPPSPDLRPGGGDTLPDGERPSVGHPVTFTTKMGQYALNTTYLIGQTPAAIRRKQLEEMAAECGALSVHHFAEEVLRSTSAQRVAQLRRFYISLGDPQLTTVVEERFPETDTALTNPNRAARIPPRSPSGTSTPRARSKRPHKRAPSEPLSPELSDGSLDREAAATLDCTSRTTAAGSAPPSTRAMPSPMAQELGRGIPYSPRPSGGQGCGPTPTHRVLLTELIGDTSILDGLFRPKTRTAQQGGSPRTPPAHTLRTTTSNHPKLPSEPSASTPPSRTTTNDLTHTFTTPFSHMQPSKRPPERSKARCKDFWDILYENNKESINRLTDLSEVQRMCESATLPARRAVNERENTELWKPNNKFLWKK
ncbi:DNA excision repair protein ERCC-6-like 2 [Aplochiton taeniatus]